MKNVSPQMERKDVRTLWLAARESLGTKTWRRCPGSTCSMLLHRSLGLRFVDVKDWSAHRPVSQHSCLMSPMTVYCSRFRQMKLANTRFTWIATMKITKCTGRVWQNVVTFQSENKYFSHSLTNFLLGNAQTWNLSFFCWARLLRAISSTGDLGHGQ